MLFGIPTDIWATVFGLAGVAIEFATLATVIIATVIAVGTYRANSARQTREHEADREADTRALELRIEQPFTFIYPSVLTDTGKRPPREQDRPDEGWVLREIPGADGTPVPYLIRPGATTVTVTNHGEREIRVARVEYEWATYRTTDDGVAFFLDGAEGLYPIGTEYRKETQVLYWSPFQQDGAVDEFPWLIDAPAATSARVEAGASGVLADISSKAQDLVSIAVHESVGGPEAGAEQTPVVVSFSLRAYWTIDRMGRFWEHRGNTVTELSTEPDWSRRF